jgi:hypothetical protein
MVGEFGLGVPAPVVVPGCLLVVGSGVLGLLGLGADGAGVLGCFIFTPELLLVLVLDGVELGLVFVGLEGAGVSYLGLLVLSFELVVLGLLGRGLLGLGLLGLLVPVPEFLII